MWPRGTTSDPGSPSYPSDVPARPRLPAGPADPAARRRGGGFPSRSRSRPSPVLGRQPDDLPPAARRRRPVRRRPCRARRATGRPGRAGPAELPAVRDRVLRGAAARRASSCRATRSPPPTSCRTQLADSGATVVVCLDRVAATVLGVRPDTDGADGRRHVAGRLAVAGGARPRCTLPLPKARAQRARLVADGAGRSGRRAVPHAGPRSGRRRRRRRSTRRPTSRCCSTPAARPAQPKARDAHARATWSRTATRCGCGCPTRCPGREVTLAVLPLFHVYGLTLCMLTTVLLAGRWCWSRASTSTPSSR